MKKPSITKQMSDLLGTEDKTKQVEVVKSMKDALTVIPTSVTVMETPFGVDLSVASPMRTSAAEMKRILQLGIDEVTKQIVLYEEERKLEQLRQQYANENPDKQVFDGEHNLIPPEKK